MSRVDDALKRARAGVSGDLERESAPSSTWAGPIALEDYPDEHRRTRTNRAEPGGAVLTEAPTLPMTSSGVRERLIGSPEISPVAEEQYRRLAATLHDLQVAKGLKVVLVTSAVPREGKTLTVANLALTLSGAYRRRVVLIDADLRRPALHRVLGIPNRKGLSEGIQDSSAAIPLVQVSNSLSVLTAGRSSAPPVGGLASDAMRAVLAECARRFDWVLLDAPPVMLLPDAGLLSSLVDGVIMVIRAGVTPFGIVERSVAELGRDCIIGTLLNGVDDEAIPATHYYHHYYRSRHATD